MSGTPINPNQQTTATTSNVALQEAFEQFLTYIPAKRLSRNLRNLMLEFMSHEGAGTAPYMPDLILDLEGLFRLLDCIEDESAEIQQKIKT